MLWILELEVYAIAGKKFAPDYVLLILISVLLTIGITMVYSASEIWAEYKFHDAFFFAKRQLLFAVVGFVAMITIMNVEYWTWRRFSKSALIVCFVLLILVLIPGLGW